MQNVARFFIVFLVLASVLAAGRQSSDFLNDFSWAASVAPQSAVISTPGQFNGYTNYWHSIYWEWQQYGNLFHLSLPDVARTIAQNKVDTAEELGIPGLLMEEGFLDGLLSMPAVELDNPLPVEVERKIGESNLLLYVDPATGLGHRLVQKIPDDADWRKALKSHQLNARNFQDVWAFYLENGGRKLFVVLAASADARARLRELIGNVREVLGKFDLHRGWFGTGTLLHSVTCHPGHPLEVIGQGLNQGNDWFTFSGYMDHLLQPQLAGWLAKVGLDVVTDVGTGKATHSLGSVAYGCRTWDGIKIQDMPTEKEWIRFVKERGGHIFRPVFSADCDPYQYDGYISIEGNKKQIDNEDVPFILQTGYIREEAPAAMVLFAPKDRAWNREEMWQALLARRGVGILPQGRMLGPELLRNALQMLLLDRVYLESTFGDRVQLRSWVEGRTLHTQIANVAETLVEGSLEVRPAPELAIKEKSFFTVSLPPHSTREFVFPVEPHLEAMERANPILINFSWGSKKKRTLAVMDLPPAVSVHKLLYGQAPEIVFPVSIHNFRDENSFPVRLQVYAAASPAQRPVFDKTRSCEAPPGEFREMVYRLPLQPGAYTVKVTALGAEAESRLGVEAPPSTALPKACAIDLNADGIPEFRLENDKVKVTLLAIGARIIEYIVKEKNDNVLFKLWPEKELSTDKRPFRERGFYPYGGFEDFLGQASMETHKVYEAELIRKEGPYVQVRMTADYYGNRLEKTFTLYGNSPLVEVRFALEFRNPEANMLGPQPILELGEKHWSEDVFVVPSVSGLREFRMRPEEYFGEVIFLKEGWNAGRDTEADISFIGAFPVGEPEFLHMWMNHPSNPESNHYYVEFQPWVPIFQKNVRYFSYYLWAAAGAWEDALAELRKRNLISTREPAE